jgi:hypothetical protein
MRPAYISDGGILLPLPVRNKAAVIPFNYSLIANINVTADSLSNPVVTDTSGNQIIGFTLTDPNRNTLSLTSSWTYGVPHQLYETRCNAGRFEIQKEIG